MFLLFCFPCFPALLAFLCFCIFGFPLFFRCSRFSDVLDFPSSVLFPTFLDFLVLCVFSLYGLSDFCVFLICCVLVLMILSAFRLSGFFWFSWFCVLWFSCFLDVLDFRSSCFLVFRSSWVFGFVEILMFLILCFPGFLGSRWLSHFPIFRFFDFLDFQFSCVMQCFGFDSFLLLLILCFPMFSNFWFSRCSIQRIFVFWFSWIGRFVGFLISAISGFPICLAFCVFWFVWSVMFSGFLDFLISLLSQVRCFSVFP